MMHRYFRHGIALYAGYHRDDRNCATHYLGIPMIFLAVLTVLALWRVPIGPVDVSIGTLLLAGAMLAWIALDAGVGLAMLAVTVPLALGAEWIARSGGVGRDLWIAGGLFLVGWVLQIVGHAVFERRKPAFVDDVTQMFIGPMFIVAKILVRLGLRRDLAGLLEATEPVANATVRSTQ